MLPSAPQERISFPLSPGTHKSAHGEISCVTGENAAAPRVKSENWLRQSENPRWCAGEMRCYASGKVATSSSQRSLASAICSLVMEEESSQVRGISWVK